MIDWQIAELRSADGRFRITQSQEEFCLLARDHVTGQSASISWHPTIDAAKTAAAATLPPDNRPPCGRCNGLGEYDLRIETLGDTVRAVCCDCRPRQKAVTK